MSSKIINFERNIEVTFGSYTLVMPIFTIDADLTSGSLLCDDVSILGNSYSSVTITRLSNNYYTPLTLNEKHYSEDRDVYLTLWSTNIVRIYDKTQASYVTSNAGDNSTGGFFILLHHDTNYWCVNGLAYADNIQSWYAYALSRGATSSNFGVAIPNASGSGQVQFYGTTIQSSFISMYKTIGEYIMNNASDASNDPYNNSGSSSGSGGGGGGGLDSVSGSDVSDPDLPSLSAVSTGLISIYTPTLAQLQSLGNFLWSDAFSVDSFKKIFADPWDAILGLSILGVGVSGGTDTEVHIGNIDTDIYMSKLSSQYYKFNCGSITINETWGSYLDYNPYTKVSIYLPFIGTHALNVDDIMGKTISLKYNIDILSGACVANIQCGGTVLYSFTGCCSATIPLSGSSYTNMINGILGIATSIGSMVATGGSSAPLAIPAMASSVVNGAKTDVSHSGNVSGMSGIMGVKSAYLIMEVPRICIPKSQDKYIGYPTYTTKKVGSLSGYCVFEDIKVRGNSHATMGEIEEIESIMKTGVYL